MKANEITEVGFYWWRRRNPKHFEKEYEVVLFDDGGFWLAGNDQRLEPSDFGDDEFTGPIPTPAE